MKYTNKLDTQPTFQAIKSKKLAYNKTDKPLKRSWEGNEKALYYDHGRKSTHRLEKEYQPVDPL